MKSPNKPSKHVIGATTMARFQGPIPPPAIMENYDRICPGAANRILTMAEEQSTHRRKMEEIVIKARTRDSLLGIISGFLIGAIGLLAGVYVVLQGQPWTGGALSFGALAGLVGVFIYGTRESRQEREVKAKQFMAEREIEDEQ